MMPDPRPVVTEQESLGEVPARRGASAERIRAGRCTMWARPPNGE